VAESLLPLDPTKNSMTQESRYLIHPATLDTILQLSILAHHKGRASECKSAFLPVSLRRLSIEVTDYATTGIPLKATAATSQQDGRGFASNVVAFGANDSCVIRASDIAFISSRADLFQELYTNEAPFTRIAWKPDFDLLTAAKVDRMYPSARSDEMPEVPLLEQLALYQIIQFHEQYPQFFLQGSEIPFLQRYLDWMTRKVELARDDKIPGGRYVLGQSLEERDSQMAKFYTALMDHHAPETKLMVHMYKSLPAVYRGEMTGIQAVVQDNLLDDTYEYMELYSAGNKALTELVKFLSHKNPRLKILEVGGGTGSATKEVVPALKGDSLYRGYESYTFTDINSSFLAKAHDNFKQYKGMKYATFDMQTPPINQGFDSDYDLVIASNVSLLLHAQAINH
jgi:hypothetical protein